MSILPGAVQENVKDKIKEVKEYLKLHYIYDIVQNYWSGSGDTKLDNVVIENNKRYSRYIAKEEFEEAISRWNDEQLDRRSVNFESIAKLIYRAPLKTYEKRYNRLKIS